MLSTAMHQSTHHKCLNPLMLWLQVVGPTSVDVAKPLPADLEAFLERGMAAQHGAIYISMGSAAKLTKQELQSLADCVSAMPNPVLWKLSALDMPSKQTILSFVPNRESTL